MRSAWSRRLRFGRAAARSSPGCHDENQPMRRPPATELRTIMTIDKAIILSAGKGSRLYPHTEDRPKCLLDIAGRSLLEWQLDMLHASGIREMVVVTGFHHDLVEQVITARGQGRGRIDLV